MTSICAIRLSALGDVLMFVPLVRHLQKNIKDLKLTWVISKPAYYLVEGMTGVEFIVIDKPKSLKDYWAFKKQMQGSCFDYLLAAQASFRSNLLYPLIQAKRKIGYDVARAKDAHRWFVDERITPGQEHTLEGFLKFAKPLCEAKPEVAWDLPLDEEDYAFARSILDSNRRTLLINPAASKPERSWLPERYISIIKEAVKRWQVQVILTGGPGSYDKALTSVIEKETGVLNLAGLTKPKQLLALIAEADAMLCPDTGPSHMSAAVGTKVVAMHAVTNPAISGPYGFGDLVVNCYPEAVETLLKPTSKQRSWGRQVHDERAMALVGVKPVLDKLALIFD